MKSRHPFQFRLHIVRLTLLVAILFGVLSAAAYRTPSVIFMLALLMAIAVLSWIISRTTRRNLHVNRALPLVGSVDDVVISRITLRNDSAWPAFFVQIYNAIVPWPPETEPGVVLASGGDVHELPLLRPYETVNWRQEWRLQRRGIYYWSALSLGVTDPLGLYEPPHKAGHDETITVLPRPLPLDRLGFWSGVSLEAPLTSRAVPTMNATDFHGVRLWKPGEQMRRVHWKSTARTGEVHIVEWEDNPAGDLCILLDVQQGAIAGNGETSTLECGIIIAASIASHLLEAGHRFDLFFFSRGEAPIPTSTGTGETPTFQLEHLSARNSSGLGTILQALAQVEPLEEEEASLQELARQAGEQWPSGLGALVLASTRANVGEALNSLAAIDARSTPLGLIFDADSYDEPSPENTVAPTGISHSPQPGVRLIRRGESLTAILEQPL